MILVNDRKAVLIDWATSVVLTYRSGHPANACTFVSEDGLVCSPPFMASGPVSIPGLPDRGYVISAAMDLYGIFLSIILMLVPPSEMVDGSHRICVVGNKEPPVERGPNATVRWSRELKGRQWFGDVPGVHIVSLVLAEMTLGMRARAQGDTLSPYPRLHSVFDSLDQNAAASVRSLLGILARDGCSLARTERHEHVQLVLDAIKAAIASCSA